MQWLRNTCPIRYCSQVRIEICRDLKPANLLMAKGKIKIGDFGFAKKNVTQKLKNQTSVGTPLYMPV